MITAALEGILTALESEEASQKINEAKANASNDMLKVMQYVFPLVVQVEMDVIKKFGFTDNREGNPLVTNTLNYSKNTGSLYLPCIFQELYSSPK